MNLFSLLADRAEAGQPVRVGLIGAGKFGTMFLAQARRTAGIHIAGIADLSIDRAVGSLQRAGWPAPQYGAESIDAAYREGSTWLVEDAERLISADGVELVIEATGDPIAGVKHALMCIGHGRHVVMVNVEADALVGPALVQRADDAGVVYSLAYGDQPALICEMVDWARATGFDVIAAGKGTKYLPAYHDSTPDTVWEHYGFTAAQIESGDFNARMFNSFLDGTKSAIEMAAVANATGLAPPVDGLGFPPAGVDDLANICRPQQDGGVLDAKGCVEVISCLHRDGQSVAHDLRWGVYVTIEAPSDYVRGCFSEYGLATDDSGTYAAMYKPYHLIGLELGITVASAALRHEPTGRPTAFRGDVVAVAKRDLAAGEVLDGEGGFTVWGKLLPAHSSLSIGGLPIGLASGARLNAPVPRSEVVRWQDVSLGEESQAVILRRSMETDIQKNAA